MIATAESADRTLNAFGISQFSVAVKILQFIKTDLPAVMHISSAWNISANDFIQSIKVDFSVSDAYAEHTASNIHANDVRNYFVSEIRSKANDTSLSGVNIRHDTNLTVLKGILRQKSVNLFQSLIFDGFCINFQITHSDPPILCMFCYFQNFRCIL